MGGGELEKLSPRQLQVAELASQGLKYSEIASILDPPVGVATVRSHLNKIYTSLGINTKEQLGNIFANSEALRLDLATLPLEDLSDREMQLFELLASGITNGELAALMGVGRSTVGSHKTSIRRKLGLRNSNQLRAASNAYSASIKDAKDDAAIVTQNHAAFWLGRIANIAEKRNAKIGQGTLIPVRNDQHYRDLAAHGYLPEFDERLPGINLFGFIVIKAASSSAEAKDAFLSDRTADIAETVVRNEVRLFFEKQSSSQIAA